MLSPDGGVFYTTSLPTDSSRTMSPGSQLTPPEPTIPAKSPPRQFAVREDEQVSEAVIRAVSEQENVDLQNVAPLYERIDPDALDDFFEPNYDGRVPTVTSVEFDYGGYTVVVRGSGIVELH